MPLTVGYARVSTTKQEEGGLSLEDQKRRLTDAGATEVLVDVMSGAKDHRPKFRQLMAMVEARQVDVVLVCKLDRLTRSITARAELYQAFTAPDAPILKALDDGIDLSTASGRQMFDLLGALATGERERIRERINDGLEARRARGLFVGQTPWGFRLTRSGCGVEIDPALKEQVEAVLKVMGEERTLTASAKRIDAELGLAKSRSVWRTWLNSPTLCGSLPHGSKDKGVAHRQYRSITPNAFTSYLTPAEQQDLLTKFANPTRGPRSHAPEHPTRGKVICGYCGKPLQRRLDAKKQPRWLTCSNIYCTVGRRSVLMDEATDLLIRAAFHFGRLDLEKRILNQQRAKANRAIDPREAELETTIATLKQLDQALVGGALDNAERELLGLQQQLQTDSVLEDLNVQRVLDQMELMTSWEIDAPEDSAAWEGLRDLVTLIPVSLTTKQHETRTFGGKPVVVIDRAFHQKGSPLEESIAAGNLPRLARKGGVFKLKELAAAARATRLVPSSLKNRS